MIAMMITIIPIKRPATRPGFEKKFPLEFAAGLTIAGDVDSAVGVGALLPEVGAVEVDVGVVEEEAVVVVVVDDEVGLAVEVVDVDDSVVVYAGTTHEYTIT